MKKYIAKTNVSINVVLSSGANKHISFSALTGGGSVYYTDDPEIIKAMERHYKYGTLFRSAPGYNTEKSQDKIPPTPAPIVSEEQPAEVDDLIKDDEAKDEAEISVYKTIVISDPDAAKAYLADHYGYSRTKIKTLKQIQEAAAANGIVFEGI